MIKYIKNKLRIYPILWQLKNQKPIITAPIGNLKMGNGPIFVVIVGALFNQNIQKAETNIMLGFCKGFEKIGIPYKIISIFEIQKELPKLNNPFCLISIYNYSMLTKKNSSELKKNKHFVLVDPWFENSKEIYKKNGLPNLTDSNKLHKKVLSSKPDFVFTPVTTSSLNYFKKWEENGTKVVSIPLACDIDKYNKDVIIMPQFNNIKIGFVGGYWPYKAIQFEKYLRPFEKYLTIYGYSTWPYKNYKGILPENSEGSLYKQAILCPAINEPQAEKINLDICERVFKVLGSGGLPITDCSKAHFDLFDKSELIIPRTVSNYKKKVNQILENPNKFDKYKKKGYNAVMNRHTYAHRAKTILNELKI